MFKRLKIRSLRNRGHELRDIIEEAKARRATDNEAIARAEQELSRVTLELLQLEFPVHKYNRRPMATRVPVSS